MNMKVCLGELYWGSGKWDCGLGIWDLGLQLWFRDKGLGIGDKRLGTLLQDLTKLNRKRGIHFINLSDYEITCFYKALYLCKSFALVRGQGGVSKYFFVTESSYFCYLGAHAKFQDPMTTPYVRKCRRK
jgi:hypothetical protein